MIAFRLLTILA